MPNPAILFAAAIATVMTPAAPAPSGAPRMTVRTDDLNLTTDAGAATLRRRVDQAVLAMAGDRQTTTGSLLPDPALGSARRSARRLADASIAAARADEQAATTRVKRSPSTDLASGAIPVASMGS